MSDEHEEQKPNAPVSAERIAEIMSRLRNNPVPTPKRTGYSYASSQHAAELLKALRAWDANGRKPQRIMCADLGWTFHKLKQYLYSAKKYLEDNMSDDPEVARLLAAWSFRQVAGGGFEFRDTGVNAVMNGKSLADVLVDVTDGATGLRNEFLEWLTGERALKDKFERPAPGEPPLALSDDDVVWFRARLAEVSDTFIGSITSDSLKFIRWNTTPPTAETQQP